MNISDINEHMTNNFFPTNSKLVWLRKFNYLN